MRQAVPYWIVAALIKLESGVEQLRRYFTNVDYDCRYTNVYHFGIQKTGSVWIQSVLCDLVVYKYSGLLPYRVRGVRRRNQMEEVQFSRPFPQGRIVTKLYISYENFLKIPKPDNYVAFFVLRDPRELVVSWYFSTRDSHIVKQEPDRLLYRARKQLRSMSVEEGLYYCIRKFREKGKFDLLRSWGRGAVDDSSVKIVRFEDLAGPHSVQRFGELFKFLDIQIPEPELEDLVYAYSFRTLTGRRPGQEDTKSHLRSGCADSWRYYFKDGLLEYFENQSEGLCAQLGYD